MIPDPITLGHVLMLAGLLFAGLAIWLLLTAMRWRGPEHGLGTPGYARARTARRNAVYALVLGAVLFAAGCFTPLCEMAIA